MNGTNDYCAEIISVTEGLDDQTRLWRYIRLSTLLTLVEGTVFVPSIATLRKSDPTEATLICKNTKQRFENLTGDDWIAIKDSATPEERKIFDKLTPQDPQAMQMSFEVWKRELGKRRCVWCWHAEGPQSMAMWSVYARDGVAICTTPARIRNAFSPINIDCGIIGRVEYADRPEEINLSHSFFLRPYLLKREGYKYESEVRVIFPSEPREQSAGHKLTVDFRTLIAEIRTSPFLPRDEELELVRALRAIINSQRGDTIPLDRDTAIFESNVHYPFTSHYQATLDREPRRPGIANFGFINMPFILSDDIHRELKPARVS
jgi:hypothetical protein